MRRLGARILTAVSALVAIWACVPKPGPNRIGGKCAADSECQTSLCWEQYLLDDTSWAATPGGHCTFPCTSDGDCLGQGRCINFGTQGAFCGKACTAPSDCRAGYACHFGGFCIPTGVFVCDPTIGDGRCTTFDGKGGGCIRAALGSGITGFCQQQCGAGPTACPNTPNGLPQKCLLINTTVDVETGAFTGDAYRGSFCSTSSVQTPLPDGAECLFPDGYLAYGCVAGSQCYFEGSQPLGQGYDENGDFLCHRLCALTGAQCPPGTTCRDVFGLRSSVTPVGMCL